LSVHRRRGTGGIDAADILPGFTGVAMHDAWAPYDTYTEATHALCSAHALRELVAVRERGSEQARSAGGRVDAPFAQPDVDQVDQVAGVPSVGGGDL
jgi:hypothetical protein